MKKLILLSACILAACGGGEAGQGVIEISDARINPPLPGQTTAVAFMTFDIKSESDRLLGISSPISDRIELHTHTMQDGIMRMRQTDGINLPKGRTVKLEPGGLHVMIFDANVSDMDETTITIDYETANDVTLVVPILPRGTMPAKAMDDHSGH